MSNDPFASVNYKTQFNQSRYTEVIVARLKQTARFCTDSQSVIGAYQSLTSHAYKACEDQVLSQSRASTVANDASMFKYSPAAYLPLSDYSNLDRQFTIQNFITPQDETESVYWERVSSPFGLYWLTQYAGSQIERDDLGNIITNTNDITGFWSALNTQTQSYFDLCGKEFTYNIDGSTPPCSVMGFSIEPDFNVGSPYDVYEQPIIVTPEGEPADTLTYTDTSLSSLEGSGQSFIRYANDKYKSYNSYVISQQGAYGGISKTPIPIDTLFNTGVDDNNSLLAIGSTDTHYFFSEVVLAEAKPAYYWKFNDTLFDSLGGKNFLPAIGDSGGASIVFDTFNYFGNKKPVNSFYGLSNTVAVGKDRIVTLQDNYSEVKYGAIKVFTLDGDFLPRESDTYVFVVPPDCIPPRCVGREPVKIEFWPTAMSANSVAWATTTLIPNSPTFTWVPGGEPKDSQIFYDLRNDRYVATAIHYGGYRKGINQYLYDSYLMFAVTSKASPDLPDISSDWLNPDGSNNWKANQIKVDIQSSPTHYPLNTRAALNEIGLFVCMDMTRIIPADPDLTYPVIDYVQTISIPYANLYGKAEPGYSPVNNYDYRRETEYNLETLPLVTIDLSTGAIPVQSLGTSKSGDYIYSANGTAINLLKLNATHFIFGPPSIHSEYNIATAAQSAVAKCAVGFFNRIYTVDIELYNGLKAIRWREIMPFTDISPPVPPDYVAVILQTGLISDPSLNLECPSIALNAQGNIVIGCSASNTNTPLSACYITGYKDMTGSSTPYPWDDISFNGVIKFEKPIIYYPGEDRPDGKIARPNAFVSSTVRYPQQNFETRNIFYTVNEYQKSDYSIGMMAAKVVIGDRTPTGGGGGSTTTISVGQDFESADLNSVGFVPPDTNGAVSANYIVQLINGSYRVFSKTGTTLINITANQFFNDALLNSGDSYNISGANFAFDTRIIYDSKSDKWYAVGLANKASVDSTIIVAVTVGNDPATANWRGFSFKADSASVRWADFPGFGINASSLFITVNMHPISGLPDFGLDPVPLTTTVNVLGIPITSLTSATPSVGGYNYVENNPGSATGFTIQPAIDHSGDSGTLIAVSRYNYDNISIFEMPSDFYTNGMANVAVTFINVTKIQQPPARQPGIDDNIETGTGIHIYSSVRKIGGKLWMIESLGISGRAALQWFNIDIATKTVTQSGVISDGVLDVYYGSIAANSNGDVVIGFSASSDSAGVMSCFVAGTTTNGVTSFGPITQVSQTTNTLSYNVSSSGRNRFGDYSATVFDPSSIRSFWTFQEYVKATNLWATRISQITFSTSTPDTTSGHYTTGRVINKNGLTKAASYIENNQSAVQNEYYIYIGFNPQKQIPSIGAAKPPIINSDSWTMTGWFKIDPNKNPTESYSNLISLRNIAPGNTYDTLTLTYQYSQKNLNTFPVTSWPGQRIYLITSPDIHTTNYSPSNPTGKPVDFYINTQVNVGDWVFVALSKEGKNLKLTINGQSITISIPNKNINNTTIPAATFRAFNTIWVASTVDDLRIYNTALTQSNLKAIQNPSEITRFDSPLPNFPIQGSGVPREYDFPFISVGENLTVCDTGKWPLTPIPQFFESWWGPSFYKSEYDTLKAQWGGYGSDVATLSNLLTQGTYKIKTVFDLSGYKLETVVIEISATADDCIADVLVNGISTGLNNGQAGTGVPNSNINAYVYPRFLSIWNFRLPAAEKHLYVDGENTIEFKIIQADTTPYTMNPIGLLVSFTRKDGIRIIEHPSDKFTLNFFLEQVSHKYYYGAWTIEVRQIGGTSYRLIIDVDNTTTKKQSALALEDNTPKLALEYDEDVFSAQVMASEAPTFAVSKDHIVMFDRSKYKIYDKKGNQVLSVDGHEFWKNAFIKSSQTPPVGAVENWQRDLTYSARILYDVETERWYAAALTSPNSNNHVMIAVTTGKDPALNNWRGFAVKTDETMRAFGNSINIGIASGMAMPYRYVYTNLGEGSTVYDESITNTSVLCISIELYPASYSSPPQNIPGFDFTNRGSSYLTIPLHSMTNTVPSIDFWFLEEYVPAVYGRNRIIQNYRKNLDLLIGYTDEEINIEDRTTILRAYTFQSHGYYPPAVGGVETPYFVPEFFLANRGRRVYNTEQVIDDFYNYLVEEIKQAILTVVQYESNGLTDGPLTYDQIQLDGIQLYFACAKTLDQQRRKAVSLDILEKIILKIPYIIFTTQAEFDKWKNGPRFDRQDEISLGMNLGYSTLRQIANELLRIYKKTYPDWNLPGKTDWRQAVTRSGWYKNVRTVPRAGITPSRPIAVINELNTYGAYFCDVETIEGKDAIRWSYTGTIFKPSTKVRGSWEDDSLLYYGLKETGIVSDPLLNLSNPSIAISDLLYDFYTDTSGARKLAFNVVLTCVGTDGNNNPSMYYAAGTIYKAATSNNTTIFEPLKFGSLKKMPNDGGFNIQVVGNPSSNVIADSTDPSRFWAINTAGPTRVVQITASGDASIIIPPPIPDPIPDPVPNPDPDPNQPPPTPDPNPDASGFISHYEQDFTWPENNAYVLLTLAYDLLSKNYDIETQTYSIASDLKFYANAKQISLFPDLADPAFFRKKRELVTYFQVDSTVSAMTSINAGVMDEFDIYRLYTHLIRYQRQLPPTPIDAYKNIIGNIFVKKVNWYLGNATDWKSAIATYILKTEAAESGVAPTIVFNNDQNSFSGTYNNRPFTIDVIGVGVLAYVSRTEQTYENGITTAIVYYNNAQFTYSVGIPAASDSEPAKIFVPGIGYTSYDFVPPIPNEAKFEIQAVLYFSDQIDNVPYRLTDITINLTDFPVDPFIINGEDKNIQISYSKGMVSLKEVYKSTNGSDKTQEIESRYNAPGTVIDEYTPILRLEKTDLALPPRKAAAELIEDQIFRSQDVPAIATYPLSLTIEIEDLKLYGPKYSSSETSFIDTAGIVHNVFSDTLRFIGYDDGFIYKSAYSGLKLVNEGNSWSLYPYIDPDDGYQIPDDNYKFTGTQLAGFNNQLESVYFTADTGSASISSEDVIQSPHWPQLSNPSTRITIPGFYGIQELDGSTSEGLFDISQDGYVTFNATHTVFNNYKITTKIDNLYSTGLQSWIPVIPPSNGYITKDGVIVPDYRTDEIPLMSGQRDPYWTLVSAPFTTTNNSLYKPTSNAWPIVKDLTKGTKNWLSEPKASQNSSIYKSDGTFNQSSQWITPIASIGSLTNAKGAGTYRYKTTFSLDQKEHIPIIGLVGANPVFGDKVTGLNPDLDSVFIWLDVAADDSISKIYLNGIDITVSQPFVNDTIGTTSYFEVMHPVVLISANKTEIPETYKPANATTNIYYVDFINGLNTLEFEFTNVSIPATLNPTGLIVQNRYTEVTYQRVNDVTVFPEAKLTWLQDSEPRPFETTPQFLSSKITTFYYDDTQYLQPDGSRKANNAISNKFQFSTSGYPQATYHANQDLQEILPNMKLSIDGVLSWSQSYEDIKAVSLEVLRTAPITIFVTAKNGVGESKQQFLINFDRITTQNNPVNDLAPNITSPSVATFKLGITSQFKINCNGRPKPTIDIQGVLPNGITFDKTTNLLLGSATTLGEYKVFLTASNGIVPNSQLSLTVNVIEKSIDSLEDIITKPVYNSITPSNPLLLPSGRSVTTIGIPNAVTRIGSCHSVESYTLSNAGENIKELNFSTIVYNKSRTKIGDTSIPVVSSASTKTIISPFGYQVSGNAYTGSSAAFPNRDTTGERFKLSAPAKKSTQYRSILIPSDFWVSIDFRQTTPTPGYQLADDDTGIIIRQTTYAYSETVLINGQTVEQLNLIPTTGDIANGNINLDLDYPITQKIFQNNQTMYGRPSLFIVPPVPSTILAYGTDKKSYTIIELYSNSLIYERYIDDIVIKYGPGYCPKDNCLLAFLGTDATTPFSGLTKYDNYFVAGNKVYSFASYYLLEANRTANARLEQAIDLVKNQEIVVSICAYSNTGTSGMVLTLETLSSVGNVLETFTDRLDVSHPGSFNVSEFDNLPTSPDMTVISTVKIGQDAKFLRISLTAGNSPVYIGFVNVCTSNDLVPLDECSANVNRLKCKIKFNGIPRQEINIFNIIARYNIMTNINTRTGSLISSLPINDGRVGTELPVDCRSSTLCNFWKQQGLNNTIQSKILSVPQITSNGNPVDINAIKAGDLLDLKANNNWIWASPLGGGDHSDEYIIEFGESPMLMAEQFLTQSMQFLIAMNKVVVLEPNCTLSYDTKYPFTDSLTITSLLNIIEMNPVRNNSNGQTIDYTTTSFSFKLKEITSSGTKTTAIYLNNIDENNKEQSILFGTAYQAGGFSITFDASLNQFVLEPYVWSFAKSVDNVYFSDATFLTFGAIAEERVRDYSTDIIQSRSFQFYPDSDYVPPSGEAAPLASWRLTIDSDPNIQLFAKGAENSGSLNVSIVFNNDTRRQRNAILTWAEGITREVTAETSTCADPATSLIVTIEYTRADGTIKEFSNTIDIENIPSISATNIDQWNEVKSFGNGLKGDYASWVSSLFVLDNSRGTGLDQCLPKSSGAIRGTCDCVFNPFGSTVTTSRGIYRNKCYPSVTITEVIAGVSQNEIQTIIVPDAKNGYYTLAFRNQTAELPYNSDAKAIAANLAGLSSIGSTDNITVTGSGTPTSPYRVEFIGELGLTELPLIVPRSENLQCISSALALVLTMGSNSERQSIANTSATTMSLVISFNGYSSEPIPYNATINQFRTALLAVKSIKDNIVVSGNTVDLEVPYTGPWFFDFVNDFESQDMPNLIPLTVGYSQEVLWKGSKGANSSQQIEYEATAGTFRIKLFDTVNGVEFSATTDPIAYNATAEDLLSAITSSANFITESDLIITDVINTITPTKRKFIIEFVGSFAKMPVKQMQLITTDLSISCSVVVARAQTGLGVSERQRLVLKQVSSGYYYLNLTLSGQTTKTAAIPFDASDVEIEQALLNLGNVKYGDIIVRTDLRATGEFRAYTLSFKDTFGNVPSITASYIDTLVCDPFGFGNLPGPPYDYHVPHPEPSENVVPPRENCCTIEKAGSNVIDMISYHREIIDPFTSIYGEVVTIKQLAAIRRVDISRFNAYTRDFKTNELTIIPLDAQISNGMSVVFIEKAVDTDIGKSNIKSHLSTSKEILPSRVTWK